MAPAQADPIKVVALGDSLTAGYGLPEGDGLVPQMQAWLKAQGKDVVMVNAGVSGDTTAGGLARLNWTLTPDVQAMIVTLGANDMLRGLDPAQARANLAAILQAASDRHLPVLLVGIQALKNYGPDYKAQFDAIYPDLSARYHVLLAHGFFDPLTKGNWDPIAQAPFFQADSIHPNAAGVKIIVAGLGPKVLELLDEVK